MTCVIMSQSSPFWPSSIEGVGVVHKFFWGVPQTPLQDCARALPRAATATHLATRWLLLDMPKGQRTNQRRMPLVMT